MDERKELLSFLFHTLYVSYGQVRMHPEETMNEMLSAAKLAGYHEVDFSKKYFKKALDLCEFVLSELQLDFEINFFDNPARYSQFAFHLIRASSRIISPRHKQVEINEAVHKFIRETPLLLSVLEYVNDLCVSIEHRFGVYVTDGERDLLVAHISSFNSHMEVS